MSLINAGSIFVLTCTIILDARLVRDENNLVVPRTWTGPHGELENDTRIVVEQARGGSGQYSINVIFNTIRVSDSGSYSCQANVSHRSSQFIHQGMNASVTTISVQGTQ